MVEMDQHEGNYLNICRHYRAMLNTPVIDEDEMEKKKYFRCAVLYLLLSPFDNEQADLLHRILKEHKTLDNIPTYKFVFFFDKIFKIVKFHKTDFQVSVGVV